MRQHIYHSPITGCNYTTAKERFEYEEKFLQRIMAGLRSSFNETKQIIIEYLDAGIAIKNELCEESTDFETITELEEDIEQLSKEKRRLLQRQHELRKLSEILFCISLEIFVYENEI